MRKALFFLIFVLASVAFEGVGLRRAAAALPGPPPAPAPGAPIVVPVDPATGAPYITGLVYIIANLVNMVFYIGGAVGLVFGAVSAIKIATAGGDPKALADAKRTLVYTILGLMAVIGGTWFVHFVTTLIGPGLPGTISLPSP